jgi:hypothetical protein
VRSLVKKIIALVAYAGLLAATTATLVGVRYVSPGFLQAFKQLHVLEGAIFLTLFASFVNLGIWQAQRMQAGVNQDASPRRFVFRFLIPLAAALLVAFGCFCFSPAQLARQGVKPRKLYVGFERNAITHFGSIPTARPGEYESLGPDIFRYNGTARLERDLCEAVMKRLQADAGGRVDVWSFLERCLDWQPLLVTKGTEKITPHELWLFDGAALDSLESPTVESLTAAFQVDESKLSDDNRTCARPAGMEKLAERIKRFNDEEASEATVLLFVTGDTPSLRNDEWRATVSNTKCRIVVVQLPSPPRAGTRRFAQDKAQALQGPGVRHFSVDSADGDESLRLYTRDAGHKTFDESSAPHWDHATDLDVVRREYFAPKYFVGPDDPQFKQATEILQAALVARPVGAAPAPPPNDMRWPFFLVAAAYWSLLVILAATEFLTAQTLAVAGRQPITLAIYALAILLGLVGLGAVGGLLFYFGTRADYDLVGRPALAVWVFAATWVVFCLLPFRTAFAVAEELRPGHIRRPLARHRVLSTAAAALLVAPAAAAQWLESASANLAVWLTTAALIVALLSLIPSGQVPAQRQFFNFWTLPRRWLCLATSVAVALAIPAAGASCLPAAAGGFDFTLAALLLVILLWSHTLWFLAERNYV